MTLGKVQLQEWDWIETTTGGIFDDGHETLLTVT